MGRKLSALLREPLSKGEQRLLGEDEVAEVRASTIEAMRVGGIRPALIYTYERTGLLVTRENRPCALFSAADLNEWEGAIADLEEREQ